MRYFFIYDGDMRRWLKIVFAGLVGINTAEILTSNEKVLQQMPEDDANPIVINAQFAPRSVMGAVSSTASISISGMISPQSS